ncbi:MAG: 1,4-dihydroxy-2-naphthoate octaprenyltransferase [Chloroflexi bacterium]|nr:1,4-dihydroxy-2-naphthoate octaprenyltransferase [Chloroflexota bacterium]
MAVDAPTQAPSFWARTGHYVKAWYWASRPFSLTTAVVPVLAASALAFQERRASLPLFFLVLLGSLLVLVGTNLADEYADHDRPEGRQKLMAPYKVIALGLLSSRAVRSGTLVSFSLATLIGIYLVVITGWPLLALCLASVAVAYGYAARPRPVAKLVLGQPLVFLFMGPVMVVGTYYVYTREVTLAALWLSLPVACLVTAILVANDLRDLEEDRAAGKVTLMTLLGHPFGRWTWTALVAAAFASVSLQAAVGSQGLMLLLPWLALPRAIRALRCVWLAQDRPAMSLAMRQSAGLHWWFGLLLAAGVGLGRMVSA